MRLIILLVCISSFIDARSQDSIFYGVFNQVKLSGLSAKDVQLNVTNGVVEADPKNASIIWIKPATIGRTELMIAKNGRSLLQKIFYVIHLKDPIAQVANSTTNTVSIQDLLAYPFIRAVIPNAVLRNGFRIRAYTLSIKKTNGSVISFDRTYSHQLEDKQLAAIRKCVKGDQLIFDEIYSSLGDNPDQRLIASITLTIQ